MARGRSRLSTERLELQPLAGGDTRSLHALWTDEGVRRYLWDGEVLAPGRTLDILEANAALFEERGFGLWGIREHGAPELVGLTGFWHFREPPELELLFGVASSRWREGIATEAASEVVRHAFEALGFGVVWASTDAANTASMRVLTKLGFELVRREAVDDLDTLFYRREAG